jgi:hypothetical protein
MDAQQTTKEEPMFGTRPALLATAIATAGLATAATSVSATHVKVTCHDFHHRGYHVSGLHGQDLTCRTVQHYAAIVIEHGTGYFGHRGWLCFESASTDGSGVAGCELDHTQHGHVHKFSLKFKPHTPHHS